MPPKKRNENKHLPPRVYQKHGAYYYVDVNKKWHRLGKTFTESMAAWSKLVDATHDIYTMNQLFDRYMIEISPKKSPSSYKNNQFEITKLRAYFGDMRPHDITPVEIYEYIDVRSLKAKVGANREKSLLSHIFSMAIRWGIVKDNPCRYVKRITEKPRSRYITDNEYKAVHDIAPPIIKFAMDFAYITGQRQGDILKIKLSDLKEDGIHIEQSKTGNKIIIQWTDELKTIISNIKKIPRSIYGMHLICTKKGNPYTADGFRTIWQKVMVKAFKSGVISERFTFHDIRAKTRSDADAIDGKGISELLGHADPRITEKVYNRKSKLVKPLK